MYKFLIFRLDMWELPKSCGFKTANFFEIWRFLTILWQFLQKKRDFARAQPNSNLQFRGHLRSNWPPTPHISSFSFKYHMAIAFFCMRLFRGCFEMGPILLLKPRFSHFNLQPQASFEVREIILWALWLPLTKVTFILRTMTSNLPIPSNHWFW